MKQQMSGNGISFKPLEYANHLHFAQASKHKRSLLSFKARCSSWCPNNSVGALKAIGCWFAGFVYTSYMSQGCGHCSINCGHLSTVFQQNVKLNQ